MGFITEGSGRPDFLAARVADSVSMIPELPQLDSKGKMDDSVSSSCGSTPDNVDVRH